MQYKFSNSEIVLSTDKKVRYTYGMAYTNRRENLRRLIEQWGGPSTLAQKLGYSNASFLVQMAGPHPTRDVSEKTARKIEAALDLRAGALDAPPVKAPKVKTGLLQEVVESVGNWCQEAGVTLPHSKFANLVTMVYQDAESNGEIRESFAKSLIQFAK